MFQVLYESDLKFYDHHFEFNFRFPTCTLNHFYCLAVEAVYINQQRKSLPATPIQISLGLLGIKANKKISFTGLEGLKMHLRGLKGVSEGLK